MKRSNIVVKLCRECSRIAKRNINDEYKPYPATCTRCQRCDLHGCNCIRCIQCDTTISEDWTCKVCRSCRSHCKCRHMPHFKYDSCLKIARSTHHVNPLSRSIGIEVELSNWGTIEDFTFKYLRYQKEFDRSVEPSQHEMAIYPMRGDMVLTGLIELGKALYVSGAQVNHTCGYHVHVGGSDLSYWEIRRLLLLWQRIERDIYTYLIAPWRHEPLSEHYCQMMTVRHKECPKCVEFIERYGKLYSVIPKLLSKINYQLLQCKSTAEIKYTIFNELYNIKPIASGESVHDWAKANKRFVTTHKGTKYELCRYMGLNFHSWMYRGTIEFRMKEAVTDLESLVVWPILCGWMVQSVTAMRDQDAMEVCGISDFAHRWCPKWIADWVDQQVAGRLTMEERTK